MNGLLSGLANSQGKPGGEQCCDKNNGIFGGSLIILIIVLLLLCGGLDNGHDCGTVCGCKKKHCKELCRCGSSGGGLLGGFGGFGSGCNGGGFIWIILLLIIFCGNQKSKCNDIC